MITRIIRSFSFSNMKSGHSGFRVGLRELISVGLGSWGLRHM